MPKRFHSAPGPSAGYGYQIERALYWLARSPAGAAVGIETDDDVAVRNGTTSLLEQDKHSIAAGAEPFGDRSKDLWNTLNIWLDAIEENRVDVETTRFLMVTNKELPDGLAKAISAATTAEAVGECITRLERAAEDPPEKIATLVGRVLRSESRDTLIKIIQNTELVDATSGAAGPQVRTDTIASLPLPSWAVPTAESILHELAGWVHASALAAWRENNPAWISRDHFINHLHAVLDRRKRNIVRERAEYLIPVSADAIGEEKGRQFVKQLFLVTEDPVLVDSSIRISSVAISRNCASQRKEISRTRTGGPFKSHCARAGRKSAHGTSESNRTILRVMSASPSSWKRPRTTESDWQVQRRTRST
jgi:hypothetical protein